MFLDPYVKVYLLCQGKRIKKKKTSVKKNTLFPVYNEALVFDVPADNIEDVSLIVKVIDYDRLVKFISISYFTLKRYTHFPLTLYGQILSPSPIRRVHLKRHKGKLLHLLIY